MNCFNKNIDETTWQEISNEFKNRNGYLSKMLNKALPDSQKLAGYLARAEIPQEDPNTVILAFSFVPNTELINNAKFLKSVAMNKVIVGGERKLNNLKKKSAKIENEYLSHKFISPENAESEVLNYFESNDFSYNDFYEYVKTFEEKINKYYTNKNIITLVVD